MHSKNWIDLVSIYYSIVFTLMILSYICSCSYGVQVHGISLYGTVSSKLAASSRSYCGFSLSHGILLAMSESSQNENRPKFNLKSGFFFFYPHQNLVVHPTFITRPRVTHCHQVYVRRPPICFENVSGGQSIVGKMDCSTCNFTKLFFFFCHYLSQNGTTGWRMKSSTLWSYLNDNFNQLYQIYFTLYRYTENILS